MPYHNKSIVITGGSSGIGLAIATALARHQNRLILLARNIEHLEAAAEQLRAQGNSEVHIYPVDISDRPYCTAVITQIGATHGIDLLINNAGISHCRYFDNITVDDFDQITQINYLGALYCTKAAWPFLKAAEPGRIVFVSSVAGYVGLIGYSSYVPTKFALTGLAESLRMEGQRFGIRVHLLYPPDTETPMLFQEIKERPPETMALSANAKLAKPEAVAEQLLKGLRKERFEIYSNFESRGIRLIRHLWPRLFFRLMDRIAHNGRQATAS